MITLNSERGFVKVENWEDIETLPGFTTNLDPKEHELNQIIGRYIFKDYIKCGLSNCHTPHGKGYIVSTKSGPITNIGHNCGKNHFDVEFDQLSKAFERDIALHTYRENIGSTLIVLDLYKEKISSIRSGTQGADALYRKSRLLAKGTSGCPEEATSIISKMIRGRDPVISIEREASKKEVDDLEVIQGKKLPRPYYIQEKVGELSGLSFLFEENCLRSILVLDLEEGFKGLSKLDVDNGSFKELKRWSAWCYDIERKIENIEGLIEVGLKLFQKNNLLKISEAIPDKEKQDEYIRFINENM
ncbi:hypothetical protein [Aeromonas media]|jgi:hypothetical protein|uniref:hypothetical protein n=1 Tax=Aeromonas media TaxID=651 RepID=UPI0038D22F59